jgi:hypothetical protein
VRIHVELLGEDDRVVEGRTFDSPLITVGGGETDDFVIDALPAQALELRADIRGVEVRTGGRPGGYAAAATIFDLGRCRLRITPFLDGLRVAEGQCPRCQQRLGDTSIGGAYRTMARRERRCQACGATVVELEAAASIVGAFSARPQEEWVTVSAPMLCWRCGDPMARVIFRTSAGTAEVERCTPCGLVVLDADDRAVLSGERGDSRA